MPGYNSAAGVARQPLCSSLSGFNSTRQHHHSKHASPAGRRRSARAAASKPQQVTSTNLTPPHCPTRPRCCAALRRAGPASCLPHPLGPPARLHPSALLLCLPASPSAPCWPCLLLASTPSLPLLASPPSTAPLFACSLTPVPLQDLPGQP